MKHLKDWSTFINEAIVDIPTEQLSDIFDEKGKMKNEVRMNISKGLNVIRKNFPELNIVDYFVVGAGVTYQYDDESDIDVTVTLDPSTPKDAMDKADKWIEKNLDKGQYAMFHKKRPYQFKLSLKTRKDLDSVDSAFDPENNTWIKEPDFKKSAEMFQKKMYAGSKEQNLYSKMEKMVQPSLKRLYLSIINDAPQKELEERIKSAFSRYGSVPGYNLPQGLDNAIKGIRGAAYSKEIEPGFVSQNWGKGNVVYKMFDREKYIDVYDILKGMVKSNKYDDKSLLNTLKYKLEDVISDEIGYNPKSKTILKYSN